MTRTEKMQALISTVVAGFQYNETLPVEKNREALYAMVSGNMIEVYGLRACKGNHSCLKEKILELGRDVSLLLWDESNGKMKTFVYEGVLKNHFACANLNAAMSVVVAMTRNIVEVIAQEMLQKMEGVEHEVEALAIQKAA